MKAVRIGSRGSKLALWQARHVQGLLRQRDPELEVSIQVFKTTGDKLTAVALAQIGGGKGVFVKEIEEALLAGEIDLAVHSLKDVPTELPEGLTLGAILPREDPRDVLIGPRRFGGLGEIPEGARLATGSLRRRVQLIHWRSDLEIVPIRGNVDTRIRKMEEQELDGVVLAAAGINRLGLRERVSYVFSLEEMVPAVGQGALAVEIREDDAPTRELLAPLEDAGARSCVEAEREFLERMGGGCQVPLGAHGSLTGSEATFSAFVASPSNGDLVRRRLEGEATEILELARRAAGELLDAGAGEFLAELETEAPPP